MVKIEGFSFENGILMGEKLGKKLEQRKLDFQNPAGTSMHDFGESYPTGMKVQPSKHVDIYV